MNKLTKDQIKQLDKHHGEATEAYEAYLTAKKALVDILTAAAETVREFESDAQQFFDEKSERWQDSDRGQNYSAWVEALGDRASTLEVSEETDDSTLDEAVAALDTEQFPCEPEG